MAIPTDYPVKLVNGNIPVLKLLAGQTVTDSVDLGGASILGIILPNYAFSGLPLTLSFESSLDNGGTDPFQLVVDATGAGIGIAITAGDRKVVIAPYLLPSIQSVKISLSAAQPDDIEFKLIVGPVL